LAYRLSRMRDERGFTLIEMTVVVLIMSILVGIALASFVFSTAKAKSTACKANLRTIKTSLEVYKSQAGKYPDDLEDLVPDYIQTDTDIRCPETGLVYEYDNSTGEVHCPNCEP
jgi:prepilin-type N-terminal cleavage/methylation domain-containing protein